MKIIMDSLKPMLMHKFMLIDQALRGQIIEVKVELYLKEEIDI